MQVSRLGFLTRSVVVGVLTVSLATSAVGQRTRVSALNRASFEDVLDDNGRLEPGLEFHGSLGGLPDVDLSQVDRVPLINLLKEAVLDSERLYKSLRSDSVRSPELQSSLHDVARLRAAATYAVRDLKDGKSLERLFPRIQKLNTDWRLLSHQLGQAARISRNSLEIVDRIDRLEREMETLFKTKTQLDRRSLVTEFAGLESIMGNLLDELQLDPRGTDRASEIVYEIRKLGQQSHYIEELLLDYASYERIVSEYNRFSTQWASLVPEMRPIQNRYVRRNIRSIVHADSRIHDLLWLEKSANREELHQLSDTLIASVDEFFNRTPLKLVVHLKNVDSILEKADDFYGTVRNFKQSVDANHDDRTLLENYGYVEEYGTDFLRSFAELPSSTGKVVLQEIESGIGSLRAELNISGTVATLDIQKLMTTAAALENSADHLQFDVTAWLKRERESYRGEADRAMRNFVKSSQRMHRLLQSRPTIPELKREVSDLDHSWSSLYGYLVRCKTKDRAHIMEVAREVNFALNELERPLRL